MQRLAKVPKAVSIIAHSKRRMSERTTLPAIGKVLSDLRKLIQTGQSVILKSQSSNRKLHLLEYQGQKLECVYDKKRKLIVTIWPSLTEEEKRQ